MGDGARTSVSVRSAFRTSLQGIEGFATRRASHRVVGHMLRRNISLRILGTGHAIFAKTLRVPLANGRFLDGSSTTCVELYMFTCKFKITGLVLNGALPLKWDGFLGNLPGREVNGPPLGSSRIVLFSPAMKCQTHPYLHTGDTNCARACATKLWRLGCVTGHYHRA